MSDPRARVEQTRLNLRMSQAQLADALGVTQGHYSKIMSGRVPLTDSLADRLEQWLKAQQAPVSASQVTKRMQELAASIRRECIELMQLAGLAGGQNEEPPERRT